MQGKAGNDVEPYCSGTDYRAQQKAHDLMTEADFRALLDLEL